MDDRMIQLVLFAKLVNSNIKSETTELLKFYKQTHKKLIKLKQNELDVFLESKKCFTIFINLFSLGDLLPHLKQCEDTLRILSFKLSYSNVHLTFIV